MVGIGKPRFHFGKLGSSKKKADGKSPQPGANRIKPPPAAQRISGPSVDTSFSSTASRKTASSVINFRDNAKFYHLPHKESKYWYEHKWQRKTDPFFHVDVGTDCETFFIGEKARSQFNRTEHFAYIVDLDNYEYHKVVFHSFLNEILQSAFFRYSIMFLVLVNAILIGVATLPYFRQYEMYWNLVDMVILSVFIFEVIIKWIYDFRLFWKVYWNVLDFCIIALTLMAAVIPKEAQGSWSLIAVRVVRTFRSLRCVSHFTSLTIVTHTVIKSGLDMGNILLVLIIFMLVLSVMAVILFDIEDLHPQYFLDALDAWMILFICVTQDGWAQVLNAYERTTTNFYIIALYLIFAVCIGAFVFANLIVAVIVANLELSVKELRESMKLQDNPLEFTGENMSPEVEVIPVYELLSKNNYVCMSQRPLKIPRLKKLTKRKLQVYMSLVVALEQNMLEADIIALDLEKILAVILSIIVQIDVHTGKLAKKEREEALAKLAKIAELASKKTAKEKAKNQAKEEEYKLPDNFEDIDWNMLPLTLHTLQKKKKAEQDPSKAESKKKVGPTTSKAKVTPKKGPAAPTATPTPTPQTQKKKA